MNVQTSPYRKTAISSGVALALVLSASVGYAASVNPIRYDKDQPVPYKSDNGGNTSCAAVGAYSCRTGKANYDDGTLVGADGYTVELTSAGYVFLPVTSYEGLSGISWGSVFY